MSWYSTFGSTLGLSLGATYGVETGLGAGAIFALLGIRWAMGRWQKAKKRWWEDWRRVGEGLDRDVNETISKVLRDQATVVPTYAAKELESLAAKRREELEHKSKELEALETELEAVEAKRASV